MQANDISHLVYEIIRSKDDRQTMMYEDDRSHLVREIEFLGRKKDKLKEVVGKLSKKYKTLHSSVQQLYCTYNKSMNLDLCDSGSPKDLKDGDDVLDKMPNRTSFADESSNTLTRRHTGTVTSARKQNELKRFKTGVLESSTSLASENPKQTAFRSSNNIEGEKRSVASTERFDCPECKRFYDMLLKQGLIDPGQKDSYLRECSKHKSKALPSNTPPGFWDLSLVSPEDWRS